MKTAQKNSILVVDDAPTAVDILQRNLESKGYRVFTASNVVDAVKILESAPIDLVITDYKMPRISGLDLVRHIRANFHETEVIMITGYASVKGAVQAVKMGADEYLPKPFTDDELFNAVEWALNKQELRRVVKNGRPRGTAEPHGIIGKSKLVQQLLTEIEKASKTSATVLILGESGTGKELVARAIHYSSKRASAPFVPVNCGAIPEKLLESELFGHVKGAFTGAIKDKPGRFELANGGTIFLDEIDAFSPALQVKLLRVLQEGEFERVGDNHTVKVDVRVITATNQDLEVLITQNKFRKDLYYRLNIIAIELPPLRERKGDIPLLVEELIHRHAKQNNKKITGISPDALSILINCNWAGNIRELENVIERAVILCKNTIITPADFPDTLNKKSVVLSAANQTEECGCKLKKALQEPEKDLLVKALESQNWNRNETAKSLGINRTTLYKKMLRFGLLKSSAKK